MDLPVVFERVLEPGFDPDFYYAHVPTLGLTTHGVGIEGARVAAHDLAALWLEEKRAAGEPMRAILKQAAISADEFKHL